MNCQVTFRPEAENDVEAAVAWYSSERAALALAFVDNLDQLLLRLRETPLQFPEVAVGVRRALMARFPYGVFFQVVAEQVVILGVLHLHRNPSTWRSRRGGGPAGVSSSA